MKVLVTGVAGFIGSRLAGRLIADGHEVRGLDSFLTGFKENIPDGCDFLEADLRDLDAMHAATRGVEVVFHQAARRSVAKSVDDPRLSHECNATGTLNLLIAAHGAGVRKFVYASSSSVYGDPPEPLRTETQVPRPISPYAVSKLAGEHYGQAFTAIHGLPVVSLRYFNVFGPGQHRESKYALLFPAFVEALVEKRAPEVDWDGHQSRDFTFIDDIVEANLKAANAGPEADGESFNIGAGHGRTVNEVLEAVSDAVGRWIDPVATPKRPGDVRHTLADIGKAKRLLGWEPRADWDASVRACVDWFAR
ncbi:MAG TPA: NAD-dependent epimerase/dehydratase family protein [Actinomycetota bacterium]|nr:NAD-dependent epimerase/dehydratase family protein [Actinomycetota bacterium]